MDLIVDLPESAEGHNAILVFVDHLSKMVRLIPTRKDLKTEGFAALFFQHIFPHYGMPERIISDRGQQWNSEFFKELCDYADIRLHLSTAYHPQTNGLVERMNEVAETALRHFVAADHKDWNRLLPFIEFALNSSKKDATGTTPFHMNRVTVPKDPFQAVVSNSARNRNDQSGSSKDRTGTRLELSSPLTTWMGASTPDGMRTGAQAHSDFQFARRCVELAKCRMKQTHDSKGVRHHLYQPGDKVWLSYKHISLRHPSRRHKFVPRFYGPVQVEDMVGTNAIRLAIPPGLRIHPTVPVSLVKPYKPRAGVEVAPVSIDGELEYELEAVIDHKITKTKRGKHRLEFEVLWKGDYDTTWQEFEDFENSMQSLEKYLGRCTLQTRRTIFKFLTPEEIALFSPTFRATARKIRKQRDVPTGGGGEEALMG